MCACGAATHKRSSRLPQTRSFRGCSCSTRTPGQNGATTSGVLSPQGMIDALARVMRQGAELRFATDIDDYAGWTLARFLASPHFRWAATRADDWRQPWPEWRPTRYEAKARSEGRGSVYLTFVRL